MGTYILDVGERLGYRGERHQQGARTGTIGVVQRLDGVVLLLFDLISCGSQPCCAAECLVGNPVDTR